MSVNCVDRFMALQAAAASLAGSAEATAISRERQSALESIATSERAKKRRRRCLPRVRLSVCWSASRVPETGSEIQLVRSHLDP